MLKAWCMFDDHTFAPVALTTKDEIVMRVRDLCSLKRGATFFIKDGDVTFGRLGMFDDDPYCLEGNDLTDEKVATWAAMILDEIAFIKLMDA